MRREGWRLRPNPAIANSLTIEEIRLLDGPPSTRADVQACIVDPAILYEPGGAPGGGDAVVNDEVIVGRVVEHLILVDGTWRLDDVEVFEEWRGVTSCPAAS